MTIHADTHLPQSASHSEAKPLAESPEVAAEVVCADEMRERILRLEAEILKLPEQTDCPTRHYFAPGLYAREMFIPAGTVLTGAVHKVKHLAVFVGDITVWTDEGMKRLTGHHTFVSEAGAKRAGYAHADTYCTGFFVTDKTDIRELEEELCEDADRLLCNRVLIAAEVAPLELEAA